MAPKTAASPAKAMLVRSLSPTKKPAGASTVKSTSTGTTKTGTTTGTTTKSTTAASKSGTAAAKKTTTTAATAKTATKTGTKTVTKTGVAAKGKAAGTKEVKEAVPEVDPEEVQRQQEEEQQRQADMRAKAAAEMEELRKAAWMAQVEYDKKQQAKARKKAEEEAKRRKEEANIRKALLEAAFDDEVDEVKKLLEKGKEFIKDIVDCADGHGNTLVSEAAAGGALETVQLLLGRDADPNSQGEFKRTPLWRAAFLGKTDVIIPLLESGADPRIGNEQGELPCHVATVPAIKQALEEWDISRTDVLVEQWKAKLEARATAAIAERAQALKSAEGGAASAKEAYDKAQQTLRHSRMELEKRIFEHDTCVEEKKPDDLIKVTLEQIHTAEAAVEVNRKKLAEAAEKLDMAKFKLREEQAAGKDAEEEEALPGIPIDIKDLDDVLVRDVGGKISNDGRWPLVIDPSGQTSVFLRYMDSNYMNMLSSNNTEPNRLRRSILGGLRYGKPVVFDILDVDSLWSELPRVFDAIQPGLLSSIMDRSIMKPEKFTTLIKAEDGEEYEANKFQDVRLAAFKVFILTSAKRPNEELLNKCYAIRVLVRG